MRVKAFLEQFEGGVFAAIASAGLDGHQLLRTSRARLTLMVRVTREDDDRVVDEEALDRLFEKIREEARRVDHILDAKRERVARLKRHRHHPEYE